MAHVVLLYDRDCPNISEARAALARAYELAGAPPQWEEVDLAATDTPASWRGYGSPSVLVNGLDVAGFQPTGESACCRTYLFQGRRAGAPPVELLVAALSAER